MKADLEGELVHLFFGQLDGAALQYDDADGFTVVRLLEVEEQVALQDEVPLLKSFVHFSPLPEPAFLVCRRLGGGGVVDQSQLVDFHFERITLISSIKSGQKRFNRSSFRCRRRRCRSCARTSSFRMSR